MEPSRRRRSASPRGTSRRSSRRSLPRGTHRASVGGDRLADVDDPRRCPRARIAAAASRSRRDAERTGDVHHAAQGQDRRRASVPSERSRRRGRPSVTAGRDHDVDAVRDGLADGRPSARLVVGSTMSAPRPWRSARAHSSSMCAGVGRDAALGPADGFRMMRYRSGPRTGPGSFAPARLGAEARGSWPLHRAARLELGVQRRSAPMQVADAQQVRRASRP